MLEQVVLERFATDDFLAATGGFEAFGGRFAGFKFWHGLGFCSTRSLILLSICYSRQANTIERISQKLQIHKFSGTQIQYFLIIFNITILKYIEL